MPLRRFGRPFFLLASFAILGAHLSSAQVTNVTSETATPALDAGHDYIQLLNETINPASGSLSIRIGLPTAMAQRQQLVEPRLLKPRRAQPQVVQCQPFRSASD